MTSKNGRSKAGKQGLIIAALFTLGIGLFVVKTVIEAGVFRTIVAAGPTDCWPVEGIIGGEDHHWRPGDRELFSSSADRRDPTGDAGAIFLVRPFDRDAPPVNVTPELSFPFHPHGISLWVGPSGEERLFVVNHRTPKEHTIEVFDVGEEGSLTLVRSIEDAALIAPNDLVAYGPEQFYVTNDHGSGARWAKTLESYLQLGLGNVLHFDGRAFSEVYKGSKYANGINMSLDGTKVYLSETVGRRIKTFERSPDTASLRLIETLDLGTGPDNIDIAPDGSLWVAAHPNLLAFGPHGRDGNKRAPAEVLRLVHGPGGGLVSEQIYMTDGDPISAPATATMRDGLMVIGPVFDPFLLVCRMGDS